MSEQLQAIATVLSLVNPAICAAIFFKIEADRTLVQDQKQTGRGSGSRIADALKAMIAIGVTAIITLGVMLVLSSIGGKNQGGLVHETVTRFMGLIVIAMGVQFALTGFKSFMA